MNSIPIRSHSEVRELLLQTIENVESIDQTDALLKAVPLASKKQFLQQFVKTCGSKQVHHLYHQTASIESFLPSDILQLIVSFNDFHSVEYLNKSFRKLVLNQKKQNARAQQLSLDYLCRIKIPQEETYNIVPVTWIINDSESLEGAIEHAAAGDMIKVNGGDYGMNDNDLWIDKHLKIIGVGPNVYFRFSGINIDSFVYFENINFIVRGWVSIGLENQSVLSVNGCTFDYENNAIHIRPECNVTIRNSKFKGYDNSMWAIGINYFYDESESYTKVSIIDCLFTNCGGSVGYPSISMNMSNRNIKIDKFHGNRFIQSHGWPLSDVDAQPFPIHEIMTNNSWELHHSIL